MKVRFAAVVLALLIPAGVHAQTFPMSSGTIEIQLGVAGVSLPEQVNGTYSAQPELRLGFFLVEGLQIQLEADVRVWPLGSVAPHSIGAAGHLVWFPRLGPNNRNLYLMGGGGGAHTEPPGIDAETSFDPLVRGGLGFKIPLQTLGWNNIHLTTEYRVEYLLQDETDIATGGVVAFSYFL